MTGLFATPIIREQTKPTMQLLGLFTMSNCTKEYQFKCRNALSNYLSMLQIHQQKHFWFNTILCTKDIKNNTKTLVDFLLPLTEEKNTKATNCDNTVGSLRGRKIDRTIIFTYLSFELTRLTSALILPTTDILVISVTEQPM